MTRYLKYLLSFPLVTLLLLTAASVEAQDTRSRSVFEPGKSSTRDLIVILDPTEPPPEGSEVSISLPVRFAYDSSALSSTARNNLSIIAGAMQASQLADVVFIVEGHTDASGSVAYNDGLSLRRARSAAAYLVELGVARTRLTIRGYGERVLLPEYPPRSSEQRRVEFVRTF